MHEKPTSFDIAYLAGVSQPTVSRALRGSPMVSLETRKRIEEIARQLNYRVDKNASNLRSQHSNTLALLLFEDPTPDDSQINPFFLSMLGSLTRASARQGYDLLISFQQFSKDWQQDYEDSRKADGIILLGYGDYEEYRPRLVRLVEQGTHFVRWGPVLEGQPGVSVGCDNLQGGYDVTRHLLGAGRRSIAFLGNASTHYPEFFDRYRGYERALMEAKVPTTTIIMAAHDTRACSPAPLRTAPTITATSASTIPMKLNMMSATLTFGAPLAQPRPQPDQRLPMQLADARLADAEHGTDFLEVQLLVVVQGHDQPLAFGQRGDGLAERKSGGHRAGAVDSRLRGRPPDVILLAAPAAEPRPGRVHRHHIDPTDRTLHLAHRLPLPQGAGERLRGGVHPDDRAGEVVGERQRLRAREAGRDAHERGGHPAGGLPGDARAVARERPQPEQRVGAVEGHAEIYRPAEERLKRRRLARDEDGGEEAAPEGHLRPRPGGRRGGVAVMGRRGTSGREDQRHGEGQ